jgi:hypothetical protein
MLATADGLVLVIHYSTCTGGSRVAQVARKAWNSGQDNNDTELASFLACSDASIDNGATDGIEDWSLLVASGGNCSRLVAMKW